MMTAEETPKSSSANADLAEQELRHLDRQAEKGTYLSKFSYMCGWIDLYAPDAPAAEWGTKPWKLVIENDADKGSKVTYRIKPEHAFEAFQHNGLVAYKKDWHAPMPDVSARLTPSDVQQDAEPVR